MIIALLIGVGLAVVTLLAMWIVHGLAVRNAMKHIGMDGKWPRPR